MNNRYSKGTLTILLINLATVSVNVTVDDGEAPSSSRSEFHLTQSHKPDLDLDDDTGLKGAQVLLNGALLSLGPHGDVPNLTRMAKTVATGSDIVLAPESIAFVTTGTLVPHCS